MISRLLIPTLFGALLAGFLAGCAPASDNQSQVQATPAPETQNSKWKTDQLMATGGDLVFNQSGVPYFG